MPSYQDTCLVCGRTFRNSTVERLAYCSVACQLEAASPTVRKPLPATYSTETLTKGQRCATF